VKTFEMSKSRSGISRSNSFQPRSGRSQNSRKPLRGKKKAGETKSKRSRASRCLKKNKGNRSLSRGSERSGHMFKVDQSEASTSPIMIIKGLKSIDLTSIRYGDPNAPSNMMIKSELISNKGGTSVYIVDESPKTQQIVQTPSADATPITTGKTAKLI